MGEELDELTTVACPTLSDSDVGTISSESDPDSPPLPNSGLGEDTTSPALPGAPSETGSPIQNDGLEGDAAPPALVGALLETIPPIQNDGPEPRTTTPPALPLTPGDPETSSPTVAGDSTAFIPKIYYDDSLTHLLHSPSYGETDEEDGKRYDVDEKSNGNNPKAAV
ncbi:hypothetical protein BD779DRAFT_1474119 [Infundibulicybe gibba]|nr:hypothetical protein BD779DRAFT_1474119 [Infundibulicybe gibba]